MLLRECPEHVILSEGPAETDITVRELDRRSAKVYRYLKERGLGREDMICILLPRGAAIPIALFGVWKAGAAAVLIENHDPPERVSHIQKDCGCVLVLDEKAWEDIQRCEPLEGHEALDPHAAAFAVYTSGTSGNPKGVLHEYGRIAITYASYRWNGKPINGKDDVVAVYSPLNFVASIMYMIISWMTGMKFLIVPYSVVRDPVRFQNFYLENRVTTSFFPPSLFRTRKDLGPYLKRVILSSEPAHGIWRDPDEVMVFNGYCSSETACGILVALLDRPNEEAPVGRPQYDVGVYLLGEDGSEAAPGEAGELCFDAPYTRGYMNLPELNQTTFVNGVFHSGDLARQTDDGQYRIVGRLSDTVKINGKRVEPAEVEEAIKKVTGIQWVAVRGFSDESGAFLCAYHLGDAPCGLNELREKLGSSLPYYMLPSFLIQIDNIPRRPNGKMDRNALPRPSASDCLCEYAPPSDDTERRLCDAMQKLLKLERIGVNDDFFLLGGDSLRSMELILETDLRGLDVEDIYYGRTPAAIAKRYADKRLTAWGDPDKINEASKRKPHPLTVEQRYVMNYELYTPDTTMYNLPVLVKVGNVRAEALAAALEKAIRSLPALLTVFCYEGGELMQRYAPELMPEITVENVSEEELAPLRETLVQPFGSMMNRLLWRCRVFCALSGNYFFFDAHHALFDGTSYWLFLDALQKCLAGMEHGTDYYYYTLARREEEAAGELYREAGAYFKTRYGRTAWSRNLRHDFASAENVAGELTIDLPFSKEEYDAFENAVGLSRNGLFIAAGLLALSVVNQARDVMLTWMYHGRRNLEELSSAGLLYVTLPASLRLTDVLTVAEMLADIRDQLENAMKFSAYPYVSSTYISPVVDDCLCLMLQDGIRNLSESEYGTFPMEQEELEEGNRASQTSLDVEITTDGEKPNLFLDYAGSLYKRDTIERYGKLMRDMVGILMAHADRSDMLVRDLLP